MVVATACIMHQLTVLLTSCVIIKIRKYLSSSHELHVNANRLLSGRRVESTSRRTMEVVERKQKRGTKEGATAATVSGTTVCDATGERACTWRVF